MFFKKALQAQGIIVSAIRSPTVPAGTERLRITLSAGHQSQHIEQLLDALSNVQADSSIAVSDK